MKVGDIVSGFQLKKQEYINEVKSVARLFEHKKSGARLLHLENDDDNKVFSIAFKTPSYDDTGVPHILEHSVLCGSKNFPTKDPFLELLKSSLQTYLNAATYPDKTIYPVASKNEKDFFNLMNVYLDAVFYPKIYEKPEIFMQEGWRYHLVNEKDKLSLNGIVYSEMKGSYSFPELLLEQECIKSLYSDMSYAFSYGGDPETIPKLTYEKFLEFHRKYYHPSNSYIYLYGNGDIKKQLEFLDKKYLSSFEKKRMNVSLGLQKPFQKMKVVNSKYSISKDETSKNKTYFALNYACEQDVDKRDKLGLSILVYYLLKTKSAPLKKAILDKNIAFDVFGHFETDVYPPYVTIWIKNSESEKSDELLQVVEKTLKQFLSNGLNKELLKACINFFEFNYREADYESNSKGLSYNLNCLKTWIYGGNPTEYLYYEKTFKELRDLLESGYFEKLLKKYFLENTHSSLIVLEPEKGFLEKKERQLQKKLDSYKKNLSEGELKSLVKKTLDFEKYQNTPDAIEDVKKIPKLKVEDLKKNVEKIPLQKEKISDIPFLHNPLETNGICYLKMAFDTKFVPQKKLYPLNILVLLLGRVATKKYTYEDLDIFVKKNTGGCSFGVNCFLWKNIDSKYIPNLMVRGKVLNKNFPKLVEILFEIICESKFDDKKHIKELIQEEKSSFEMAINSPADDFAMKRLNSYFSEYGKYDEHVSGLSYYHYLCDLLKDFDVKWDALKKDLEYLMGIVFNKSGLVVNMVCEKKEYGLMKEDFVSRFGKLQSLSLTKQNYKFELTGINEGLLIQSHVHSIAQGNNFKSLGYNFSGKLLVLGNVVSKEYFWEEIRVRGGAYGASYVLRRNGDIFFFSYRNPNLIRTFSIYKKTPEFLKSFKTESIDKFIIGVIGGLDKPLTVSMKGEKSLQMYLCDITDEDFQKERDEVLSTTVEDLRGFSSLIEDLLKTEYYCVLGNEGEIKRNKKLFNSLVTVHK